jgi:hypothetical protein
MSVPAIGMDVVFDHPGAADLAERFRVTASALERQAGVARALPAQAARGEWRGSYADQFDQRLRQCCADGLALAAALRHAAAGLEELSVAARQEQRRREQARAWEQRHSPHGLAAIVDNVSDFVFGEDDIPPPPPPAPQPRFLATACGPRSRGC